MLINNKMPTMVGILTFTSMINLCSAKFSMKNFIFNVHPSFSRRYSVLLSLIGWLFLYHVICGSGIPDAGQVKLTVLSLTVSGVSTLPCWSTFGGTVMRRRYS